MKRRKMKLCAAAMTSTLVIAVSPVMPKAIQATRDSPASRPVMPVMKATTPVNSANRKSQPVIRQLFDDQWWNSAAQEEQRGFVAGYIDCYTSDVKGQKRSSGRLFEYQQAVADFYRQHPRQNVAPTGQVLRNALQTLKTKYPPQPGGEVWDEPHGFFDGRWWREADERERIGFVEGYLWCYGNDLKRPSAHFSQSAGEYVELMTNYFSDPQADRSDAKIAHVLCRFRDKPGSRSR